MDLVIHRTNEVDSQAVEELGRNFWYELQEAVAVITLLIKEGAWSVLNFLL